MSVYDVATTLAGEIKNSKEYKEFKKYMNEIKKDKDAEKILKEYKSTQLEIQKYLIQNRSVDKTSKAKMDSIQSAIGRSRKLQRYLVCEKRFTGMMDNINKIIAQYIEQDYK